MPFWRCFYHAIWSTHKREPAITPALEKVIFEAIQAKSRALGGTVYAVNGTEDHVHVAASIPPSVSGAEWMRTIKGLSAHNVNDSFPNLETTFRWQKGYGLLTFGVRALPDVVEYIQQQKEHHAKGSTKAYLEEADD